MYKLNIPESWQYISLTKDLVYKATGVEEYQGDKLYFSTGSINKQAHIAEGKYSYAEKPSRANRIGCEGDVLQARMKGTNKCVLVKGDQIGSLFSTGFIQLRGYGSTVLSEYIFHYLNSNAFLDLKDELCSGSTQSALNDKAADKLLFPLPPRNEQLRIVNKLDELFPELDKGIEYLEKSLNQVTAYREALLKSAYEGKLSEQWRKDNPEKVESPVDILAKIQQEREQRYQNQMEEWKQEVAEWEKDGKEGKKPSKPKLLKIVPISEESSTSKAWQNTSLINLLLEKPSNGKSVKDLTGGFPVLRLTALKSKYIDVNESKEGLWTEREAKPYLVKKGDFLLSRGNGSIKLVGKGALVNSNKKVAYPDTIVKLALSQTGLVAELFSYFWNSAVFRQQIQSSARTTAGIYKINQAVISEYSYPLISQKEQVEILKILDEKLSIVDKQIIEIENQIKLGELLRQSIYKKAFSGQLVPQDPNDEPASELLKKIATEKAELAETEKVEKTAARKAKAAAKKVKT